MSKPVGYTYRNVCYILENFRLTILFHLSFSIFNDDWSTFIQIKHALASTLVEPAKLDEAEHLYDLRFGDLDSHRDHGEYEVQTLWLY